MLDVLRNAGETFEAQEKFSAALQDTQWPIRMISLYGLSNLSQGEDFQKVLNWMYQSDEQELIRELAAVEGANTGMMNEQ
jgi:HEAT repeat protein